MLSDEKAAEIRERFRVHIRRLSNEQRPKIEFIDYVDLYEIALALLADREEQSAEIIRIKELSEVASALAKIAFAEKDKVIEGLRAGIGDISIEMTRIASNIHGNNSFHLKDFDDCMAIVRWLNAIQPKTGESE